VEELWDIKIEKENTTVETKIQIADDALKNRLGYLSRSKLI
jgi:hypothetical protein